jgi:protein-disulfide isomerase
MGSRLDALASVCAILAALTVGSSYVYKTFVAPTPPVVGSTGVARPMEQWQQAVQVGHVIAGDSTAPSTLVIFADLECPACRGYNTTLQNAIAKHAQDLRVIYVSFPLSYHRFAMPAARATECVSRRGKVRQWIDVLYQKQDSLGLKSWSSFAQEAGIQDTAGINLCAMSVAPVARIDASLELGKQVDIKGTPTIAIDGWVYPSSPSSAQIDSAVASALKRRS